MALTPEQRALLELVLSRGLSYEEIGDLTGAGPEDARARTRGALVALGDGDPGDVVGAFLVGQASEEQRSLAVEILEHDPGANGLARRIRAGLVLAVHGAAPPEVPTLYVSDDGGEADAENRPTRGRLAIAVALGAVCLSAGVLAITGAFSDREGPIGTPATNQPDDADQDVARIALRGADGSDARGSVAIGVGTDNVPYLDLDLTGLEPGSARQLHLLWVDFEGGRGLPLPDPIVVAGDGSLQERLVLPLELAEILEVGRTLEVVLTDRDALERVSRAVTRAGKQSRQGELDPSSLPRRPGVALLRGRISA